MTTHWKIKKKKEIRHDPKQDPDQDFEIEFLFAIALKSSSTSTSALKFMVKACCSKFGCGRHIMKRVSK